MSYQKKKQMNMQTRDNLTGWMFIAPAALLILTMSFIPIFRALVLSFHTGLGENMEFVGFSNYIRMFQDTIFKESFFSTIFYLIQVPIMLVLALVFASILNSDKIKFRGLFRVCIFLPCATSLVSYSVVFKSLFASDGIVNLILTKMGILSSAYDFLGHPMSARIIIIAAMIWRWTGYNMVFFLSGLQNIDPSVYEAAKIDGANSFQAFWKITLPLLKPTVLFTTITSINGVLQLFDESMNLTNGGPGTATLSLSHYVYNISFKYVPNFGYAAAISFFIMIVVAIMAFVQMKVGDKRE